MNHHPFYLYEPHKSSNFVIHLFFPISQAELRTLINMRERIGQICDKHTDVPHG